MRKTKRFTAQVITRFLREERGTGQNENYIPWHKVSRGDPSSRGRSHLLDWQGRLRELLSDGELAVQYFVSMLPGVVDCREQFPLSLHAEELPPAWQRRVDQSMGPLPGSLQIAEGLGIKHPLLRSKGCSEPWIMTTDLLLNLNDPEGATSQLAIAFKPTDWQQEKRTVELLKIEKAYWHARGVQWLLLTPSQYDRQVTICMRRVAGWALDTPVSPAQRDTEPPRVSRRPIGLS